MRLSEKHFSAIRDRNLRCRREDVKEDDARRSVEDDDPKSAMSVLENDPSNDSDWSESFEDKSGMTSPKETSAYDWNLVMRRSKRRPKIKG